MNRLSTLYSLIVHAVLVSLCFVFSAKIQNKKPAELIEIKIQSPSADGINAYSKFEQRRKKGPKNNKNINLFPSMKSVFANKVSEDNKPELARTNIDESLLPGVMNRYSGMTMGHVKFVKSLWHEIDNSIWESPYLSEYGHVGKVTLTFQITQDGKLYQNKLYADAQNSILKVVAARAVRQAVLNKNNELVFPEKTTQVTAQFLWATYAECERFKGNHQNVLSFCKYGEDKRKRFTNSEKASTYLGALKYGPGFIEEIEKYQAEEFRRKVNFDPFEEIRRDPDYNI